MLNLKSTLRIEEKLSIHVTFSKDHNINHNIELGIIIKSQDESLNKSRIAKFNDQLYCSKGDESFRSTLRSNL